LITPPPSQKPFQVKDAQGRDIPDPAWIEFCSEAFKGVAATQQSGTTANRPTKGLWVGRFYLDTDLGIPIWYSGTGTVWWNASGASV
jgi:hypothetical protein